MIPNFTSTSDMLGFLRALPKNADYTKMLKDDFNIEAPTDAPAWQKEYLWKYGVQGKRMGLEGLELIQYAAESAQKFIADHPYQLVSERFKEPETKAAPTKTPKAPRETKGSGKVHFNHPDGAVVFLEHRQVWVGYFGGKIVGTKKTKEKMEEFMRNKYSLLDSSI